METKEYDGIFFLDDEDGHGHIRINSSETILTLVGEFYRLLGQDQYDLHGRLSDGTHVSLLQCVTLRSATYHNKAQRKLECTIHAHYAILGHRHFKNDKIKSLHYTFSGGTIICGFSKSFKILHPRNRDLKQLIDAEHASLIEDLAEKDFKPEPWGGSLGEDPIVAFFDGNYVVSEASFSKAEISISNAISYSMPSSKGSDIKNTILHNINFREGVSLEESIHTLKDIHKLYELLLGHRQKYEKIYATIEGEEEQLGRLDLHWSGCNNDVSVQERQPHPIDIPALATENRKEFEYIVSAWMDSMPSMASPRLRLLSGMLSKTYDYNRIIGAANVFDLLPNEKVPRLEEVPAELLEKIDLAKVEFKGLPSSPIRDSILSALGRAGKPSLRAKINHRAQILNNSFGGAFGDIELLVHHAVLCRNHYVHGSTSGFNYEDNFHLVAFLTDTLEFIFAASDLVECGWNALDYRNRAGTGSHQFHSYLLGYDMGVHRLRTVLSDERS